jgi:DNA-directed RNA polymerase subunit RPC12/RpoP
MVYNYVCMDCGKEFTYVKYKRPNRRFCTDCAIKHVRDSVTQLHEHQGDYYEKWKEATKRAIANL